MALLGLLIAAAILRLRGLGNQSLWNDEAATQELAATPFSRLLPLVDRMENTPPLYYLLINRWARLAGTSERALRLPSALFGVAAVAMIYLLGREAAGDARQARWLGLLAAGGLAISRYHIAYSQEARAYALMFLLATVSCHAVVVLLRRTVRWAQWEYVLASAAMLWTHPMSVFVLVGQGLFVAIVLIAHRGRGMSGIPLRRWAILGCTTVLLFGPWIPKAMTVASGGQPWMPTPHLGPTLVDYVSPWPALAALLLLAGIGAVAGLRRRQVAGPLGLLLLVTCVALPTLLSQGRHPIFTPRYGIAGLIGLYLAAAAGAMSMGRTWGTVALILACLPTFPDLAHDARLGLNAQVKADLGSVAQILAANARPDEIIWCPNGMQIRPLRHYLGNAPVTIREAMPPTTDTADRGWLVGGPQGHTPAPDMYDVPHEWPLRGVTLYELHRRPTTRPTGNPAASRP